MLVLLFQGYCLIFLYTDTCTHLTALYKPVHVFTETQTDSLSQICIETLAGCVWLTHAKVWTHACTYPHREYTRVYNASWQKHGGSRVCKTTRRRSERGDEKKRALPYCPKWLGPSIDQRTGGRQAKRGREEQAPGLVPQLSCGLCSVPLQQAGQGRRGIHQRVSSIYPSQMRTHKCTYACTHIALAFEKRPIWWHHLHFLFHR